MRNTLKKEGDTKMNDMHGAFSKQVKGIFLIAIGSILLLHQLGILPQRLDFYVVIMVSIYLIVLGILKLDGGRKLKQFMQKEK